MILNLTTGSSGNAAADGAGATLTVHVPITASVTVQSGEAAYTKTTDESGMAVFHGLTTGLWTITASDGVNSFPAQYIQVTADYSAELDYELYLYKEGDTCAGISGGWASYIYGCPSKLISAGGDSRLRASPKLALNGTSAMATMEHLVYPEYYRVGSVFAENAVTVGDFSTVRINVKTLNKESSNKVWLAVTNTKADNFPLLAYSEIKQTGETSLNIGNIGEAIYVVLLFQSAGSSTNTKDTAIEFDRVWLQ